MSETLRDCIESAQVSLVECLDGDENYIRRHGCDNTVSDLVSECADTATPIYNCDLIAVFQSDNHLWYAEPEEAEGGIINQMGRVVYDAISQGLYEYISQLEGEPVVCEQPECEMDGDHLDTDEARCTEHCSDCDECGTEEEASE